MDIFKELWSKINYKRKVALIEKSGLFDKVYYLRHNPDVAESGIDPLKHYILFGGKEGRNPCQSFDAHEFMLSHPEWKKISNNALLAFLKLKTQDAKVLKLQEERIRKTYGATIEESRDIPDSDSIFAHQYKMMLHNALAKKSKDYVEEQLHDYEEFAIKTIAFYLPQFHPIPENNEWWGKGFTEWTNVSKAAPQFKGHYQPRLPGELGFYDLRVPEVMQRQAELAKNYGIHAFCFHYYWFSGRRLLEKPLNLFMENVDFPFCICWANENWTKRWDGKEQDLLMAQEHTLENDKNFIKDLLPVLKHPQYLTINERPLVIVYHISLLENPAATAAYWRSYCLENGISNPYLVAAKTFGLDDITGTGFDATVEFPPHNIFLNNYNKEASFLNEDFNGQIFSYTDLLTKASLPRISSHTNFKTVVPGWDNTARRPDTGFVFKNATPASFGRWLEEACIHTLHQAKSETERIVFINAWNEWAEGAYLEPDRRFGYAFLQEHRDILSSLNKKVFQNNSGKMVWPEKNNHPLALIIHVYYEDILSELAPMLEKYEGKADFYFSIPETKPHLAENIWKYFPYALVLKVKNKGRDISPFLEIFHIISRFDYLAFLKIHSKKSLHRMDGAEWRADILNKLLGPAVTSTYIQNVFEKAQHLGAIGPQNHIVNKQYYWGFNAENTEQLALHTGLKTKPQPDFQFIAGSMFWGSMKAFSFLNQLPAQGHHFEDEPLPKDGALPHAIERLFGWGLIDKGFVIQQINEEGQISDVVLNLDYAYAQKTNSLSKF